MTKGTNRSGSDAAKRIKALTKKSGEKPKDRGGRNIGAKDEHSKVPKGNLTHQKPMKQR